MTIPIPAVAASDIYQHASQLAKQSNNNDFATMLAAATSAAPAATTPTTPTTSSASSSVDISQLARQLLLGDASNDIAQIGKPLEYTDAAINKARQTWVSRAAHASPEVAEKLLQPFVNGRYGILLDMREAFSYTGPPRYLGTGEPVNDATDKYIEQAQSAIDKMKQQIYSIERKNGTPAADILDKLFVHMDNLPNRIRKLLQWDDIHTI